MVSFSAIECDPEAPVPTMVMVEIPALALSPTVSFNVEAVPLVTELGWKDAVTPEGKPDAERAMVCGLPDTSEEAMAMFDECSRLIVKLDTLAEIEKSLAAGALTVTCRVVEWLPLEAIPLTVSKNDPGVAVEIAETVKVEDDPLVIELGLNVAVTPVGRPVADSAIDWELPETVADEMALVTAPWQ